MAGVDNGGRSSSVAVAQGLKPSSRNAVGRQQGLGMTRQNPHSSSEAIARRARRGFSLIEAAIVLAVVGGVIGGIWYSAATVYENHKVNKTVEGTISTVRNIQKLISLRDAEEIGNIQNIEPTVVAAGCPPNDWISGVNVKSPVTGDLNIYSYKSHFDFTFYNIERSTCIKIIMKLSALQGTAGYSRGFGLGNIIVNYPNFSTNTFPLTHSQAETACTSATGNAVSFAFAYTRIN